MQNYPIKVFPVSNGKTSSGGKELAHIIPMQSADSSPAKIEAWLEAGYLLGAPVGASYGVFGLDVDADDGGLETVAQWQRLYGKYDTFTVSSPHGGSHPFFQMPSGTYNCHNANLGEGVGLKISDGTFLLAGGEGYVNKFDTVAVSYPPQWLVDIVIAKATRKVSIKREVIYSPEDEVSFATNCISRLSADRADIYETWIQVGMALKSMQDEDEGNKLWHTFSQLSDKYDENETEKKWKGFSPDGGITLGSLAFWADEDDDPTTEKEPAADQSSIIATLASINKERADSMDDWITVGKALHILYGGDNDGLSQWDIWSRQSSKYESGVCAQKWDSEEFNSKRNSTYTVNSFYDMAKLDSGGKFVKPCPQHPLPSDYYAALDALNFHFTQNEMNDRVYVNGSLLSDGMESLIMTKLRQHKYTGKQVFHDAVMAEAAENTFHPIKDYLKSLVWDGNDHITKLGTYFEDKDGLFPVLIRKWLIGAVGKVLAPSLDGLEQNPMLVLAGTQGIGKSVFVSWLGSGLPEYSLISPIYPDNKDFVINSCSHFVWEVEELGSTIRKSDVEALKAFLSRPKASFRAPYGHYEIQKATTASYIGTLNPDGSGFLNDPTGNRRYRVCHLNKISWGFRKELNINQVWAQAIALRAMGETYHLDNQTEVHMKEVNDRYTTDDPLADHIWNLFDIVPNSSTFTATSEILSVMKCQNVITSDTERVISMRLANILTKFGLEQQQKRVNGRQIRGWKGISTR